MKQNLVQNFNKILINKKIKINFWNNSPIN